MVKNKIFKSTILVMMWTIGYRILGFLRESLLAGKYGSGDITDIYIIAFSIPILIINILALGAISSAIIPIMGEYKNNNKKTEIILSSLNGNFLIITSTVTFIVILFAPLIVSGIAPGFEGEKYLLTVKLTRLMAFSIPITSISGILKSILNLEGETTEISKSNFLHNLIFLVSALMFSIIYGILGFSIALGFSVVGQLFYLTLILRKIGIKTKFKINFKEPIFKKIIILMIPIVVSTIAIQFNFIIDKIIASNLEEGSISYLNYANKIIQLPIGVILGAIILTNFPKLSMLVNEKKQKYAQNFYYKQLNIAFLIFIPITIFIIVNSNLIINIAFKRGEFRELEVIKTGLALKSYAIAVLGMVLVAIITKMYHSLKETKLPTLINIFCVILNGILSYIFSRYFSYYGIAIATSIVSLINSYLLVLYLNKKFKYKSLNKETILIIKTTLIYGIGSWIISHILKDIKIQLLKLIVIVVVNVCIYVLIIKFGKINFKRLKRM